MVKKKRLTELLQLIKDNERSEYNFNIIFNELISEYNSEIAINSNLDENPYLNNLRQTISDQAEDYKNRRQKKPNSNHDREYSAFVRNFKQDIENELRRLTNAE